MVMEMEHPALNDLEWKTLKIVNLIFLLQLFTFFHNSLFSWVSSSSSFYSADFVRFSSAEQLLSGERREKIILEKKNNIWKFSNGGSRVNFNKMHFKIWNFSVWLKYQNLGLLFVVIIRGSARCKDEGEEGSFTGNKIE